MTYLIIFIVIALVLSPVMWMMPSPAQKHQTKLRAQAMSLGLSVRVCDLPQLERAKVRKESPQQGVNYLFPWRKAGSNTEAFHYLILRADQPGGTQSNGDLSLLLRSALASMPDDVMALEYSSAGVSAYWHEKGAVENVLQIHQCLLDLTKQLNEL